MRDLNEILGVLLSEADAHPDIDIDVIVRNAMAKMNLDYDQMPEIADAFKLLDKMDAKTNSLEAARKEGNTKDGWVIDQLEEITRKSEGKGEEIVKEIQKGTLSALDTALNQEI